MKDKCMYCTHLLQVLRQSDKQKWFECELADEGEISEIKNPLTNSCKMFKEYTRNSCFDCWYYSQWYINNGDKHSDWYYFCNVTDEKLPEMKTNCSHYRKIIR